MTLALALLTLAPLALALLSLWRLPLAAPAPSLRPLPLPLKAAPSLAPSLSEADVRSLIAEAAALKAEADTLTADALSDEARYWLAEAEAARSAVPSPFTLTVARSVRSLSGTLALAAPSLLFLTEADAERETLSASASLDALSQRLRSAASVMAARSVAEPLVTAAETLTYASDDAATLPSLTLAEADTLRRYVSESDSRVTALIAAAERDTLAPSASLAGSALTAEALR